MNAVSWVENIIYINLNIIIDINNLNESYEKRKNNYLNDFNV